MGSNPAIDHIFLNVILDTRLHVPFFINKIVGFFGKWAFLKKYPCFDVTELNSSFPNFSRKPKKNSESSKSVKKSVEV